MGYVVRIDRDACISSGTCVNDSPESFGLDDEDIAEPLPGLENLSDDRLLRLARNCPVGAILLYEQQDGHEVDLFA